MTRVPTPGGVLEVEGFGAAECPTVLLVNGLGSQLLRFPAGFCESLAAEGFRVVRYDQRGVGLSDPVDATDTDGVVFTLSDLAADAVAILDHLDVERAHVVGVSMGGMVAQHLAIEHPDRLRSVSSVMSTTGAPDVGRATPEALATLTEAPVLDRDGAIAQTVRTRRATAGPRFDEEWEAALAAAEFDRSFRPGIAALQAAAVVASGDRTERLHEVETPVLVIHGRLDPLIDVSGGEATALAVADAHLVVLADMGHDLPPGLWPRLVGEIARHAHAVDDRSG